MTQTAFADLSLPDPRFSRSDVDELVRLYRAVAARAKHERALAMFRELGLVSEAASTRESLDRLGDQEAGAATEPA